MTHVILQKENKGWKSTVGFHCFYSSKLLAALYNFDVSSDTPALHPGQEMKFSMKSIKIKAVALSMFSFRCFR